MELRQLQFVVAVARKSSFTKAAADLLVAQPALSTRIRKLETELGTRLFDRTTRRVSLTPAGRTFLARAERIVAECEIAGREMAEYAGGLRGIVRVGAWYPMNPGLPDLLGSFISAHPGIELAVREENSDLTLDLLRRGELDVALPVMREDLDLHNIDYFVYLTEPFVVITPCETPLAEKSAVSLDDLRAVPLIVLMPGSAVRAIVESGFAAAGVRPNIAIETTDANAARAFVSRGLGVSLIPRSVAEADGSPVAIVPLRRPPIRRSAVAWRSNGRTRATDTFVAHVRTTYPDATIVRIGAGRTTR